MVRLYDFFFLTSFYSENDGSDRGCSVITAYFDIDSYQPSEWDSWKKLQCFSEEAQN